MENAVNMPAARAALKAPSPAAETAETAKPAARTGRKAAEAKRRAHRRAGRPISARFLAIAAAAAALALLALDPPRYAAACAEGIALWAKAVLPALFPYFVLTGALTRLGAAGAAGRLFSAPMRALRLPPAAAYCFAVSALSGYPAGSRTAADLAAGGTLPRGALRTAALCSTAGPMFLLGTVGGAMFRDPAAGAVLLASHLAGVILVILVTAKRAKPAPAALAPAAARADGVLQESVHAAVVSVLCVGGAIAFFSVLCEALSAAGLLRLFSLLPAAALRPAGAQELAEGFVCGLVEATRGCAVLAGKGGPLALPLCAFLVTFGGACILAQQLGYLRTAGVRALPFLACKAVQGAAAFLICLALSALFL